MTISLAQEVSAQNAALGGTTLSVTASGVQANDIIEVFVLQQQSLKQTVTISADHTVKNPDDATNTFKALGASVDQAPPDDSSITHFCAIAIATASTIFTVTFGATQSGAAGIWVKVIRGADTTTPISSGAYGGQVQTAVGNTTDAITSG